MLTIEEKRQIIEYIAGWSVKPIFDDGVIDYGDGKRWNEVSVFLDECRLELRLWGEKQK